MEVNIETAHLHKSPSALCALLLQGVDIHDNTYFWAAIWWHSLLLMSLCFISRKQWSLEVLSLEDHQQQCEHPTRSHSELVKCGRLHSSSPTRTDDLTNNHAIRHAVLTIYFVSLWQTFLIMQVLSLLAGMQLADMQTTKNKEVTDLNTQGTQTNVADWYMSRLLISISLWEWIHVEREWWDNGEGQKSSWKSVFLSVLFGLKKKTPTTETAHWTVFFFSISVT